MRLAQVQFVTGLILVATAWLGLVLVATIPTWLLWNWLVPDLLGLPPLTILQALGLLLLFDLLLGRRPRLKFTANA